MGAMTTGFGTFVHTDDVFYRFEDHMRSGGCDEYDNPYPSVLQVYLHSYRVLKYTPKGAWIATLMGKRFVLLTARKRWACPTIDEARDSFNARKNKQIQIYSGRVVRAQRAIVMASHMTEKQCYKPIEPKAFWSTS
jgi:hypothetical protein